jgi:hypothetical protein
MTASAAELRQGIIDALPDDTSTHGQVPALRNVYLPLSHAKALQPDTMVVSGGRGAGKSFWWAALQEGTYRDLIGTLASSSQLSAGTDIYTGFGERPQNDEYPGADVLRQLLDEGTEARMIWRTVVVRHLADEGHPVPQGTWSERVQWVTGHPEAVDRLLAARDQELHHNNTWSIGLFDALDRSAADWPRMHKLIRGLLQTALDLRPYRRLRAKCFLRSDQLDESQVANFPDASKVLASKLELSWPRIELYGLLWQYLGNAAAGAAFRQLAGDDKWTMIDVDGQPYWRPLPLLLRDESLQRSSFHRLTGEWMGKNAKRGFPYVWIPSHLADGQESTSPRSFIAALRKAAEDTAERYPDHGEALHYEGIKRGVQRASQIRVDEVGEDYPWVNELMMPLKGVVVPCDFDVISERWRTDGSLARIQDSVRRGGVRLPPAHLDGGAVGVREDLEELSIFVRMKDSRTNIPDVFRVGYGLGRRGGVKPIRGGGQD